MPFVAEFVGTFLLILLGNGVVANALLNQCKGNGGGFFMITAGWGVAVAVGVFASGHLSGGHINPAVTLAFAVGGTFSWVLVPGYILAQLAGAMAGSLLVFFTYRAHYGVTDEPGSIGATFFTSPAIRSPLQNFVTELVGTAILVFGVLAIFAPGNHTENPLGPAFVGLLVFGIGMSLGGPTGYAINPARDLGPRIIHTLLPIRAKGGSDWSYSWVPIFGPITGGVIGGLLFGLSGIGGTG